MSTIDEFIRSCHEDLVFYRAQAPGSHTPLWLVSESEAVAVSGGGRVESKQLCDMSLEDLYRAPIAVVRHGESVIASRTNTWGHAVMDWYRRSSRPIPQQDQSDLQSPPDSPLFATAVGESRMFMGVAYLGGTMMVKHFGRIAIDLAGIEKPPFRIPLLRDHDREKVAGFIRAAPVMKGRLMVSGDVTKATPYGRELIEMLDDGCQPGLSIGGNPTQTREIPKGIVVSLNGHQLEGPFTLVEKLLLHEVSACSVPADRNAHIYV